MTRPRATAPASGVRVSRKRGERLVLALDDTMAAIEGARLEVTGHLAPLALSPAVINRLEVMLEELITNVVRHGFAEGAGYSILLAVEAGPGDVEITLEDDGRPFDPTGAPEPAAFTTLEAAPIGGLGLKAVRRWASAWRYEASPDSADWRELVFEGARPVNRLVVRLATE
jgi:anti-sigma regulatory factor (Ser/Thr protein kinase)